MLHITNGDSAANHIRETGFEGEVLPWRDVLHEGPVPAELSLEGLRDVRVRFIAIAGWGPEDEVRRQFTERDAALARFQEHEEVVLWFEHDLFDQLQLLQLLDWFSERPRGGTLVSMVLADDYLTAMSPGTLRTRYWERPVVGPRELDTGRRAWKAFRSPDPRAILALFETDLAPLPFLEGALRRHLQQFPSVRNGLSRSEAQALEVIASGGVTFEEAFRASHHAREERVFLGDAVFAWYLEGLSRRQTPLVLWSDGASVLLPRDFQLSEEFRTRRLQLTEAGHAVLEGREDRVHLQGIDRWLGGVYLRGRSASWRWSEAEQTIQQGL